MNIVDLVSSLFRTSQQPAGRLSVPAVTDENFFPRGLQAVYTDRKRYDRESILAESLKAWRIDPIARRLVKLQTQFVIGPGIYVTVKHKATQKFVEAWWHNEHNNLDEQIPEWMDELTRTGDLFILFSIDDVSGMSYVRALPSDSIKDIQTAENDVRQELYYIPTDLNASPYPAYSAALLGPERAEGPSSFVLHYAINRPVGSKFGEADLTAVLPWIGRYAQWLEERAKLNHFRQVFYFMVRGQYTNQAERDARQNEIMANPPATGSVLVTNKNEEWSVLSPQLASHDANEDGLALKKMISAGAGIPLHFLAEPESSTRTTAEAAGTPTWRGMEQVQVGFLRMLTRMVKIAVRARKVCNPGVRLEEEGIRVIGPDIREVDNTAVAQAASSVYPALANLYDRGGIEAAEFLRMMYRFMGEEFKETAAVPEMHPHSPAPSP